MKNRLGGVPTALFLGATALMTACAGDPAPQKGPLAPLRLAKNTPHAERVLRVAEAVQAAAEKAFPGYHSYSYTTIK